MIKKVKDALTNGAGCRVYGVLDVQRVAGNFHISVHGLNIYVAQMIFGGSNHVNVSHVIHDLSFGPIYPGLRNPLDETTRTLCDTSGTFKCYIKNQVYLRIIINLLFNGFILRHHDVFWVVSCYFVKTKLSLNACSVTNIVITSANTNYNHWKE
ncbi:hypothetical protein TanjilG_07933 [Lupinus angustifolius]|uniref:Endoplasmic reticulum vesicle transporter C-terminal domain-containing protein n=1 Tax=Lupinus angustifolius TaxID=3871 RepID=A0A4P1RLZ0_LUPAN|nr:hypothetical protein TanjilG_07933 [Lupinus angustifolius]